VATSYYDSAAFGDLFQWGRLDDGHQDRDSSWTTVLSSNDIPGHDKFIYGSSDNIFDWRKPQNNKLWQGVFGTNNPCPSGWRLPTITEWNDERASWSQQNRMGAFASPLKLTAAGYRIDPYYDPVAGVGNYWSSTTTDTAARSLYFSDSGAVARSYVRRSGLSVRCIKD